MPKQVINGIKINSNDYDLNLRNMGDQSGIFFKNANDDRYEVKIDENGNIVADIKRDVDTTVNNKLGGTSGGAITDTGSYVSCLLNICSFYAGGAMDKSKFAPATHNYVELCNGSTLDINLEGLYLYYRPSDLTEQDFWTVLPLKGTIPAGCTFLIRGAQCSPKSNTTLNVDTYDMEWYAGGELLAFNKKGTSFYLCAGDIANPSKVFKPGSSSETVDYDKFAAGEVYTSGGATKGYIDATGAAATGGDAKGEGAALSISAADLTDYIFYKLNAFDKTKASSKAWGSDRKTSALWTYCQWSRCSTPESPYLTDYQKSHLAPKASFQHKTIMDMRNTFRDDAPNYVTNSFGIQATYGGSSKRATRCFNWISIGYYDEFIEYRKVGSTDWIKKHSIEANGNYPYTKEYNGDTTVAEFIAVYDRQRWLSIGEKSVTSHKAIIRGLEAGTYEYRIGRELNSSYTSGIRRFKVESDSEVSLGFTFLHHSDQQGFNWQEYKAWEKAAASMDKYAKETYGDYKFTINTGDMAQSGNRESEWMDYYLGKEYFEDRAEMVTLGNNDMGEVNSYVDPNGDSKVNSIDIWYYYNFELDKDNKPYFIYKHSKGLDGSRIKNVISYDITDSGHGKFTYFCPTLYSFNYGAYHFICVNSEISNGTTFDMASVYYHNNTSSEISKDVFKAGAYYQVYRWVKADIEANTSKKKIAFMHELPFHICAPKEKSSNVGEPRNAVNGSSLNIDFSSGVATTDYDDTTVYTGGCCFSELFQNNDVRVCLGGHKHTFSLSKGTKENITGAGTASRTVTPNSPIVVEPSTTAEGQTSAKTDGVIYAMTQATGYKLISNKEMPGSVENDKWIWKYFMCTSNGTDWVVNAGQSYPMFYACTCKSDNVLLEPYYIDNIYVHNGNAVTKFDMNKTNSIVAIPKHIDISTGTPIKLKVMY